MKVIKKRKPEEQIYRVVTRDGARYIRAVEVVPGLLVHPDIPASADWDWDENDYKWYCWTVTHKDTGRALIIGIMERYWAVKAARKLNKLCSADAERHWMLLNKKWVSLVKLLQNELELTGRWPKDL